MSHPGELIPGAQSPGRRAPWLAIAFCFCIALGLATIFETLSAAEGIWYWYASFLHQGRHLYGDMHLALQPLFVLETSAWMTIAGKGWLISKLPAVLHLVAFCVAILLLVRETQLRDFHRGLLFASVFLISISFEAYRFDDYHVLADCFGLYSLLLLIHVYRSEEGTRTLAICAGLGILSGLCIMTRLNDGAALLLAILIALVLLVPRQRLLCVALVCLSAVITCALIVRLTGDSYRDYLTYSIFRAASSKGGSQHVLRYPLELPIDALRRSYDYLTSGATVIVGLILATLCVALPRALRRRTLSDMALAAVCLGLLALAWRPTLLILTGVSFLQIIAGYLVVASYSLGIWVAVRIAMGRSHPATKEISPLAMLVFTPLGLLAAGSMSSGGSYLGLYEPIALLILISAIAWPSQIRPQWLRDFLTATAILLVISTASGRIRRPYSWHTYRSQPLYAQRTVYRSPLYGPMIAEPGLLRMLEPVCSQINSRAVGDELLSLPFPFANYFCNTPPWHGYVQTFYDTSTQATIETLMGELEQAPPKWILYQRQLHTLALHETIYNGGKPLVHRRLDELIMKNIESGKWQVTYSSDFGNAGDFLKDFDNHWYLIRTR